MVAGLKRAVIDRGLMSHTRTQGVSKMAGCKRCGRATNGQYEYCYLCFRKKQEIDEYHRYRDMSEDEKEDERELYYSTMCVMCGKEGASERKDGKCYCGECWTIWNS